MTWLTYRQLRAQALAALLGVAALAAVLAAHRARVPTAVTGVDDDLLSGLSLADRRLFFVGVVVLAVVPALLGAFWGAPMVARELESGTYRLAWNQSVTRARWLAVKLTITCVVAAVVAGTMSFAVTRWSRAVDAAAGGRFGALPGRMTPVAFAMRGIAPVAYAVFAVVLGVAVGLVLRRALPAVAVTLALFVAVQVAVPHWVRPHLLSPTQTDTAFSRDTLEGIEGDPFHGVNKVMVKTGNGAWVLSHQLVNTEGQRVVLPTWFSQCLPQPGDRSAVQPVPIAGKGGLDGCLDRLTAEGYRDRVRYFGPDRFWAMQWAETALFGLLSAGLVGFCFWWTRKRIS